MCNELDRIAFYIWRRIDSHLFPTSFVIIIIIIIIIIINFLIYAE